MDETMPMALPPLPPDPVTLLAMLFKPLELGGEIARGINNVAQAKNLTLRRHSDWGDFIPVTTTTELDDQQIM